MNTYNKLLMEIREQLSLKEIFGTSFIKKCTDIVTGIVKKYNATFIVNVKYVDDNSLACTDGKTIILNVLNPFSKNKDNLAKYSTLLGALLHEIGHILYTNLAYTKELYERMIKEGELLASTPSTNKFLKEHQSQRKTLASLFFQVCNILEDAHIEPRLLKAYPGYSKYLVYVREQHMQMFDSYVSTSDMIAEFCNLLLFYSKYNLEPNSENPAATLLLSLKDEIHEVLAITDSKTRVTGYCSIFEKFISEMTSESNEENRDNSGSEDNISDDSSNDTASCDNAESSSSSNESSNENSSDSKDTGSKDSKTSDETKESTDSNEQSGQQKSSDSSSDKTEESKEGNSTSSKEDTQLNNDEDTSKSSSEEQSQANSDSANEDTSERSPESSSSQNESSNNNTGSSAANDEESNTTSNGTMNNRDDSNNGFHSSGNSKTDDFADALSQMNVTEDYDNASSSTPLSEKTFSFGDEDFSCEDFDDIDVNEASLSLANELSDMIDELAEEILNSNIEREIEKMGNTLKANMDFGNYHSSTQSTFKRVSEFNHDVELVAETKQVLRRLIAEFLREIEKLRKGSTLKGLYCGRRLSEPHRVDMKRMSKKIAPQNIPDMEVTLLVDHSGSMSGRRIEYAKKTALIVYLFCKELNIPVSIYGHCAIYNNVLLEKYTSPMCTDGHDVDRLCTMQAHNAANRDGYALRFCAEELVRNSRANKKVLIIISDGAPNDTDYGYRYVAPENRTSAMCQGNAKPDIQETLTLYKKKGISFITAGLGRDRAEIEDIYCDGLSEKTAAKYLDISELEKMPKIFVKVLKNIIEHQ